MRTKSVNNETSSMILLDDINSWEKDSKVVVSWSEVNIPSGQISVPLEVEKRASEIQEEYLAWVYNLGQLRINKESIVSHLKIFDSFSFWWMTLISEKSIYRCPSIYQVFKLRALEKLYIKNDCQGLTYCGHDLNLHRTLEDWCKRMRHPYNRFSSRKCEVRSGLSGVRKIASYFPFWIQAISFIAKKWFSRLRHRKAYKPFEMAPKKEQKQALIVTYFPYIDLKKSKEGRFRSLYLGSLHDLLDALPLKINWVWMYADSQQMDFKETIRFRDRCNQEQPEKNQFFLVEDFFTWGTYLRAIKLYLKLYFKGLQIKKARESFHFPDSRMNFFPILEYDWKSSLFGFFAISGIFETCMFDRLVGQSPEMRWGLFTGENQPWEVALISSWKKYQKDNPIMSFQHFPGTRQLDPRLYHNPKVFQENDGNRLPLPDKKVVNSAFNYDLLKRFGYPEEKLYQVEDLRSLNLLGRYGAEKKPLKSSDRILLVVTGVMEIETNFQLNLLKDAGISGGLDSYTKVLIKPHPDLPVEELIEIIEFDFGHEITCQTLDKLWPQVDVIYCANSTSVCAEASWLGLPVIMASPKDAVNLNPLYGVPGAEYISSGGMLAEKLENPKRINIPNNFYGLDGDLPLWRKLLDGISKK
jgi:surface carbohydrate biosynthesis protein (TIGR04326 family)